MRSFLYLTGLSLSLTSTTTYASLDSKFEEFKLQFKKAYSSYEEELKRFKIFTKNMETAALMNGQLDEGSATYGHLSPLADQSEEEFRKVNNLPVTPQLLKKHELHAVSHSAFHLYGTRTDPLPTSFDWREKGAVTEVKNQGQCGSCWSFATVANIEGSNYLINNQLVSLSEQELVDCSASDSGCNGGLPSRAYEDLIENNAGLELESDYSYTAAQASSCGAKKSLEKVMIESWVPVVKNEDMIAYAMMQYGPLAIALNASPMQMYMGGISDPWFCSPSGIDHAVTLVGFGAEKGTKYWTIKNSWGAEWGEQGYYRLVRGKGKCGMNLMVTSAVAAKTGGRREIEV